MHLNGQPGISSRDGGLDHLSEIKRFYGAELSGKRMAAL